MCVYRLNTRYINKNKPNLTKHICQFNNIRTIKVEKIIWEIGMCLEDKEVK